MKSWYNAKTGTSVLPDKRVAFVEEKVVVGGGLLVAAADAALGVSKPKLKVDVHRRAEGLEPTAQVDLLVENANGEQFKLRGVDYPPGTRS